MMASDFKDCVWYRNAMRASLKANRIAFKAAEPMYVVHDKRTGMFGVGKGDGEPDWCRDDKGFPLIMVARPKEH